MVDKYDAGDKGEEKGKNHSTALLPFFSDYCPPFLSGLFYLSCIYFILKTNVNFSQASDKYLNITIDHTVTIIVDTNSELL